MSVFLLRCEFRWFVSRVNRCAVRSKNVRRVAFEGVKARRPVLRAQPAHATPRSARCRGRVPGHLPHGGVRGLEVHHAAVGGRRALKPHLSNKKRRYLFFSDTGQDREEGATFRARSICNDRTTVGCMRTPAEWIMVGCPLLLSQSISVSALRWETLLTDSTPQPCIAPCIKHRGERAVEHHRGLPMQAPQHDSRYTCLGKVGEAVPRHCPEVRLPEATVRVERGSVGHHRGPPDVGQRVKAVGVGEHPAAAVRDLVAVRLKGRAPQRGAVLQGGPGMGAKERAFV